MMLSTSHPSTGKMLMPPSPNAAVDTVGFPRGYKYPLRGSFSLPTIYPSPKERPATSAKSWSPASPFYRSLPPREAPNLRKPLRHKQAEPNKFEVALDSLSIHRKVTELEVKLPENERRYVERMPEAPLPLDQIRELIRETHTRHGLSPPGRRPYRLRRLSKEVMEGMRRISREVTSRF